MNKSTLHFGMNKIKKNEHKKKTNRLQNFPEQHRKRIYRFKTLLTANLWFIL